MSLSTINYPPQLEKNEHEVDAINDSLTSSLLQKSTIDPQEDGRTVTVFFCGTCSNSDDYKNTVRYWDGENVSHTFSITQGKEYIDKIIVDGPGSGENDIHKLWVPYNKGSGDPYPAWGGIARGWGISERIDHVLAVLKNEPTVEIANELGKQAHEELKTAKKIRRVNIVGWSRGGAAAIATAARMYNDPLLKEIEVNLILLDPVPGAGSSCEENRRLTPNVKNCFCFYAMDENSACFSPIIPDVPEGCHYHVTFLPGGHAHVAGDESDHAGVLLDRTLGIHLRDVGTISRAGIHQALHLCGTKLDKEHVIYLTLKDLTELYEKCKTKAKYYKLVAQRVSYIFSQVFGSTRKVIHGNTHWFNQELDNVVKERQLNHDPNYIDHIHERFVRVVNEATATFVDPVYEYLQPLLESEATLHFSSIYPTIEGYIQKIRLDEPLIYRAISEGMQEKFQENDLLDLNLRSDSEQHLKNYLKHLVRGLVDSHNENITNAKKKTQLESIINVYRARKKNEIINRVHEFKKQTEAATKIQALTRGRQARKQFEQVKQAATTLQTVIRRQHARIETLKQKAAIVKTQAIIRKHQAESIYKQQKEAVTILQRSIRSHLDSKKLQALRKKQANKTTVQAALQRRRERLAEGKRREDAATTLQTMIRKNLAFKQFQHKKSAAITLQAAIRKQQAEASHDKQKKAATILQAWVRRRRTRKKVQNQKNAIIKAQALFRGRRVRKNMQFIKAQCIQRKIDALKQTINPNSTIKPKHTTQDGLHKIDTQTVYKKNFFSRHKKKILGGMIVSALGALGGTISLILIITGVILLPATFGGSAALIGIGSGLILGGALLGGAAGVGIASLLENAPPKSNETIGMQPIMTTGSLRSSFDIPRDALPSHHADPKPESDIPQHQKTFSGEPGVTVTPRSAFEMKN